MGSQTIAWPREDADALEKLLRSLLKGKFSHLYLTFNDHASNYCSVNAAISDGMYDHADWVSEEEKARAIAAESVWVIQWYPNTLVGFCAWAASSLSACLEAAFAS